MKFLISLLLASLLCVSCSTNTVYHEYHDLGGAWALGEQVNFIFSVQDTSQVYQVFLDVRNTRNYPYQNLFVRYEFKDGKEIKVSEKLLDLLLFESKTGKPVGSGVGSVYDSEHLILDNMTFTSTSPYHITFTQFMRADSLSGIDRLGLKIVVKE